MTDLQQRMAAKKFAESWAGRGDEKQDTQSFWLALLNRVFGVENPDQFIFFEEEVELKHTSFIDATIPSTKVLIEQKGLKKDLTKPIKQSDGSLLTPVEQAKRYDENLPWSQRARWIVVCNFAEFHVYDRESPTSPPQVIFLKNLETDYYRLNFLVDSHDSHIQKEMEISLQAGDLVGALYDALLKQYNDPASEEELRSLNMLCVRLVFCLYAEDSGIFGRHNMFHDYINRSHPEDVREALIRLFKILDTPIEKRWPYINKDLAEFPYVNGGLFENEDLIIPTFNEEIVSLLLHKSSEDFDWSNISPTIFGAVFESTLNPDTRRSGGMHYTSIENIHRVIDPLFLDDLRAELTEIKAKYVSPYYRKKYLHEFQDKLASLSFFDPACGSGNFLTESYLSIRRLENEIIRDFYTGDEGQSSFLDVHEALDIKVSIQQFYGIEINDFAVSVARTALWIAESQMMKETEKIIHANLDFLPLKSYVNIKEGNSLTFDWADVVPRKKLNFIIGNPPFVGARLMSPNQKRDIDLIFPNWKNAGNLDYVSCWFKKASDFMKGTSIRAALVSTNSICQGDSVALLWKPLIESGVHIDFARRTFQWDSEAHIKAHVHCVIVGFSRTIVHPKKFIYDNAECVTAKNINGYLIDGPNIFVESRTTPLCNVPHIGIGNKPIDGGFYLFKQQEMEDFIKKEPGSAKWFRPWYGSDEFINRRPRYCLWLGDCPPNELKKMPECMKRVNDVQKFRLSSKSAGTRKLAEKPTRFHVENMPKDTYIVLPKVSSENRRYIPMGFMSPEALCSDLVFVIPNATLYHFGILTSSLHMAWMRAVAGRLKSDYRYSKDVVYNNFPWPSPTPSQRAKIEQTAQAILETRSMPKFASCSLADLYDSRSMPYELKVAHERNNRAVMQAYGFTGEITDENESEYAVALMQMYQAMADKERLKRQ